MVEKVVARGDGAKHLLHCPSGRLRIAGSLRTGADCGEFCGIAHSITTLSICPRHRAQLADCLEDQPWWHVIHHFHFADLAGQNKMRNAMPRLLVSLQ